MSRGLIPVFKKALSGIETSQISLPALGDAYDTLDGIAWDIGVVPFTNQMETEAKDPEDPWFCPRKGTIAVTSILAYLEHNPRFVSNQEAVMDDLRQLKQFLSSAREKEVPFHYVLR